jgi:hypothetical protein
VNVHVRYPDSGIPGTMQFLDNGAIRVGVDLSLGGAITYLANTTDRINLVNSYDPGRQIQVDYSAGPQPFGQTHTTLPLQPWNPIASRRRILRVWIPSWPPRLRGLRPHRSSLPPRTGR